MRHALRICAVALCLISTSCAQGVSDEHCNSTLRALEAAVREGRYMYGHQDDLCYGHFWTHPEDILNDRIEGSDVFSVCGDYPAVVSFDLGGIELGKEENLDGVNFDYMRRAAMEHIARGGIVTFSWHARNPWTGGDAWDNSSDKAVSSIIAGGGKEKEFELWLERLSAFLGSIRNPDGTQAEVIFRPWHEHMGGWFWWGIDTCSADEYIALWKKTYAYINELKGLTEIIWAYSPNSDVDKDGYMVRYPGDDIVDLLGIDHYQYSDFDTYINRLKTCLGYMSELGEEHEKNIVISETGYEGIKDAKWWTSLNEGIKDYPIGYVLTWRNAWDQQGHFYGPYPGADCEEDFRSFYSLDNTLFLKDIK